MYCLIKILFLEKCKSVINSNNKIFCTFDATFHYLSLIGGFHCLIRYYILRIF